MLNGEHKLCIDLRSESCKKIEYDAHQITFRVQYIAVDREVASNMARVAKKRIVNQWQNGGWQAIHQPVSIINRLQSVIDLNHRL